MKNHVIVAKIETWLQSQAESEIQEEIVSLMMESMRDPLMQVLPPEIDLEMFPEQMVEQFIGQIKLQVLTSLKAQIGANKGHGKINELLLKKYFTPAEQTAGKASIEKYSSCYVEEVEEFYIKLSSLRMTSEMFC